jgi:hypothetical protein
MRCRYAAEFALQPVKIRNSQADWFKAEEWSLPALRRAIGGHNLYRNTAKCRHASEAHLLSVYFVTLFFVAATALL